jgi:hypothetical protein
MVKVGIYDHESGDLLRVVRLGSPDWERHAASGFHLYYQWPRPPGDMSERVSFPLRVTPLFK